jgi:hypothetical protein
MEFSGEDGVDVDIVTAQDVAELDVVMALIDPEELDQNDGRIIFLGILFY